MINHKHQFIFIHIPRTSGSSIERALRYRERHRLDAEKNDKHWNLSRWRDKLDESVFNTYFKFSIVRNPWDVVVSKYVSGYYGNHRKGIPIGLRAGKDMQYFLDHYKPAPHECGDSFHDYFEPDQMNFIGRYETRDEDLKYISEKIGCDIDCSIHLRQNGKSKHYTEYYNEETKQIVAERYAKDIAYFDYKFGE